MRRVLDDSFIVARDSGAETSGDIQHVPAPRDAGVPCRDGQRAQTSAVPITAGPIATTARIAGLPFHQDAYGGEDEFKKKGQTLLPAPSLDSYNGLIFISMDPDAEPLEEFLGDFKFYLDFYTTARVGMDSRCAARSGGGSKPTGRSGRENFAGDMYHTPQTHLQRRRNRAVPRSPRRKSARTGRHTLGAPGRQDHLQAATRHI